MEKNLEEKIFDVAAHFAIDGDAQKVCPCSIGHINNTFFIDCPRKKYVLQRINTQVFPNPAELMQNIERVTNHCRAETEKAGDDVARCTLQIVKTNDGALFWQNDDGAYRVYDFIGGTRSYDIVNERLMGKAGNAFARFAAMLANFDATQLFDVIPRFHDTKKRFADFCDAVSRDVAGRAKNAQAEIDFLMRHSDFYGTVVDGLSRGELPWRVTHNDTKLNNVLFDEKTDEFVAIIDLDTVMKGALAFDFGDALRSGCNTAAEDERDLSKVHFSWPLCRAFAREFLANCAIGAAEKESLCVAGKLITLEQALRFLGDYLQGDVYYHIDRPSHNLDRARTQIQLAREMDDAKMRDLIMS